MLHLLMGCWTFLESDPYVQGVSVQVISVQGGICPGGSVRGYMSVFFLSGHQLGSDCCKAVRTLLKLPEISLGYQEIILGGTTQESK